MNGLSTEFVPSNPGPLRRVGRQAEQQIRRRLAQATGVDPYAAIARGESAPVVMSRECAERLLELADLLGEMELLARRARS